MKKIFKKINILFLVLVLVLTQIFIYPFSYAETTTSDIDNCSIDLNWGTIINPEGTVKKVNQTSTSNVKVSMTVNVKYTGKGEYTYQPGEFSFKVKSLNGDGIDADLNDIDASKKGSTQTRGDWYYELVDGYYVFTNKNIISNSMSSSVELLYGIRCWNSINNTTKIIDSSIILNNESISSNTISLIYTSEKDIYKLIETAEKCNTLDFKDNNVTLPSDKTIDDYYFVKYKYTINTIRKVRQAGNRELKTTFPEDVLVFGLYFKDEDGNYLVRGSNGGSLIVAYPKDKYINDKLINVSNESNLTGIYKDETERVELSKANAQITDLSDYTLEVVKLQYSQSKELYSSNSVQTITKLSKNLLNREQGYDVKAEIISFANYTGEKSDYVTQDDLMYYRFIDGSFRRLTDDEKFLTKINIPGYDSFTIENYSKAKPYNYKIYIRKKGESEYKLYVSNNLYSNSKNYSFSKTDEIVGAKVIYTNVNGGISTGINGGVQSPNIKFYWNIKMDETLNENKKVVQYMDIADFDILDSSTQISKLGDVEDSNTFNNLSENMKLDILNFDTNIIGNKVYHSIDTIDIVESGDITPSINVNNEKNSNLFVKDDKVYATLSPISEIKSNPDDLFKIKKFRLEMEIPKYFNIEKNTFKMYSYGILEDGTSINNYTNTFHPYTISNLPKGSKITEEIVDIGDNKKKVVYSFDFSDNPIYYGFKDIYRFSFRMENDAYIDHDTFMSLRNSGKLPNKFIFNYKFIVDDSEEGNYITRIATASSSRGYSNIAGSTYTEMDTLVKTDNSDGYTKDLTNTDYGSEYSYKLRLASGDSNASKIVMFDNIEEGYKDNPYFKGTFNGVDTSLVEDLGATPTIYYSTNKETTHNLDNGDWVKSTNYNGELKDVKSIAVDLGDYTLAKNDVSYILVKMLAPTKNANLKDLIAYNNFTVNYEATDPDTGVIYERTGLPSNTTQVTLTGEPTMTSYTVNYYYDEVMDNTKTEVIDGNINSNITSYTDKNINGFILEKDTLGDGIILDADETKNVIDVYYISKRNINVNAIWDIDNSRYYDFLITEETTGYGVDKAILLFKDSDGNTLETLTTDANGYVKTANKYDGTKDYSIEVQSDKYNKTQNINKVEGITKPSSIIAKLYKDGSELKDIIISESDNWIIEEKDLPAANDDNTKINYNVDKVDLEGFKTTITKNNENSYTITNSKKSNDISTSLEVPSEAPDTGYKGLSDSLIYVSILSFVGIILLIILKSRKMK